MSGHSKWATIKRAKGKTDEARGKLFTKIGREIVVAVKSGGSDPTANPRLRDIISKARQNNMPNDNIQRSIKKASGELGNVVYEEITYEGYGVGGSAVIAKCLTDNKNRTAGDVRHAFDKFGGSLGSNGCVSYMFDNTGVLIFEKNNMSEDDIMMMALEAGANDVTDEGDVWQVTTTPADFNVVKENLENNGISFVSSDIELLPQNYVDLSENHTATFLKMIEKLEDLDDVQNVYHNVNLPEEQEEE